MKKLSSLLIVLGALSSPVCQAGATTSSHSTGSSTTSIDATDQNRIVATIRGTSGIADVQNDKIELRNAVVYVNGRSYGAVPADCEIKYIITPAGRQLFVNGKRRDAPPAPK